MTTTTTKKARPKKKSRSHLPPAADVATIAGREYMIVPLEDFDNWYDDHLLSILARERLEKESHLAVPFDEIEKRLDRKRKGK